MSRQVALERELEQLTHINGVVAKLIATIDTTHTDINANNDTIDHTNRLLNQWIRILSQTNYTKDLIHKLNQSPYNEDVEKEIGEKRARVGELQRRLGELRRENELMKR